MEKYNYRKAMRDDIRKYIEHEYSEEQINEMLKDREKWENTLNDILWTNDQITGNGSGSYWFNIWKAEEAVCHNFDLLGEAMQEFCADWKDLEKGAEYADVTIRCYLLGESISAVLDELEEERTKNEDL